MRILHLEASSGWGGQEIRILREAEGMRERGHEVILAVMKGGGLVSQARKEGFIVYELNFNRPAWPFCLIYLLWILRKHRIDLVNTHSSLDAWIGGIAARLGGYSLVRTRHLSTPIKAGWNSRIVYGHLADFVVTTCGSIVPMICNQSGKKMEKCCSIPTGVDPKRIAFQEKEKNEFRKKFGFEEGDFLIGTACFMRSWKGIEIFLKAANLLRENPRLKWVIIGGGNQQKYEVIAKGMGLGRIVQFSGHLENPFPALAALDVFTLLSTAHEGVSQAILQAAYLGKPLIATNVGGLGEVCIDKQTGFLVPAFAVEPVAQAVVTLKENVSLRHEMGGRARSLVKNQFTLRHTLDQMEEVYQRVIM